MEEEKVLCKNCGRAFASKRIFGQILKKMQEKKLGKFQNNLELCPQCRPLAFARNLVGEDLRPIPKVKQPVRRPSKDWETVRKDSRTGCTIYRSQCFLCNSGCDAVVHVKEGRVVKVEGDISSPVTKGTLCSKGLSSKDLIYHPERLQYPLKRAGERGEGKWERISWEEALDTVASRLKEIEGRYGKDSVGLATGTARGWIGLFWRFANASGWQHIGAGLAQCWMPRTAGSMLVAGSPILENPDYPPTRAMLIWGANPPSTYPTKGMGMMEAKARGAKMIVVDPVFSETASKADVWLQLRPGTDAALALGMLNVFIHSGLYDKEFVDRWCQGFTELKERVREYSPERVEEITWVPREKIREAARIYAATKPASIMVCVAVEQNADTLSTSRAITMLAGITGNIDVPGGNVFMMPMKGPTITEIDLRERLTPERHEKRLGSKEYPFLSGEQSLCPTAHNTLFWKAMLTGEPYPIRALYCHGNNLLVAYANTQMVRQALLRLDFFAVADVFMTETNKLADIVLPAATWMERDCVSAIYQIDYNRFHLQQKVAEVGECWTDGKILGQMAKRLGFGPLMFASDEEYCNFVLKNWNISFQEFKRRGTIEVPFTYRKYEAGGFKTPSGKVELYSKELKDLGFDPLPSYREPTESPVSTPGLLKDYPLIITTGGRVPVFRHSEFRNFPKLREIVPDVTITIHPQTAQQLGIADGDAVIVESPRGKMEARAYLTLGIDPRVVQVPSHWAGKNNVNLIMDNQNCAPLIGSTQLRCQLSRAKERGQDG